MAPWATYAAAKLASRARHNPLMSMTLPAERRAAYDAFFTGDDTAIENCFAPSEDDLDMEAQLSESFRESMARQRAGARMLDERGDAKLAWAEHFCMAYPLPKDKVKVLQAAEAGELHEIDAVVRGFQRLRVLDSSLRLTPDGRFKLISALPLAEQVRRLPVAYEEYTDVSTPGASTESYVARRYVEQGYECFEDEGGTIALLKTCSLLSELPTLRAMTQDKMALESPIFSNLAQMFTHAEDMDDGIKQIPPKKIDGFCEILTRTTPERIEAGMKMLIECSSQHDGGRMAQFHSDPSKPLRLFQAWGVERFVRACRLELENFAHWGGWPDITAFKGNEVVLIEVKQKDKLMFHQARTIARLAQLVPGVFSSLRVARITLK